MGASAIPAIGAVGALAQGAGTVASALGGQPTNRTRVPPQLEAVQLGLIESQIEDFTRDRDKAEATGLAIQNRTNLLERASRGLIPKEKALSDITRQNEQLAKRFGAEVLNEVNLATRGPESVSGLRQELQRQTSILLRNPEAAAKQDPALSRQIQQGRAQLEEQLSKQLGSGYQQSEAYRRALQTFEEGIPALQQQRLSGLSNLVGQQQQQSQSFGEFLLGGQRQSQTALAQGFQLGQQGFEGANDLRRSQQELSQIPFSTIQSFGAQSLSGQTRSGLEQGAFGGSDLFSRFNPSDSFLESRKQPQYASAQPVYGVSSGGPIKYYG